MNNKTSKITERRITKRKKLRNEEFTKRRKLRNGAKQNGETPWTAKKIGYIVLHMKIIKL